jgi:hypothetical protein
MLVRADEHPRPKTYAMACIMQLSVDGGLDSSRVAVPLLWLSRHPLNLAAVSLRGRPSRNDQAMACNAGMSAGQGSE